MKISSHIAQHLLDVYTGGNWTEVSLAQTIAGISLQEAVTVTPASPNSIAAIIHHLDFWNRVMIQRLQGIQPEIPEANGFDVPVLNTDADWKRLVKATLASASELAVAISHTEDSQLEQPIVGGSASVYKNVQGTVEHIHYHLGQIVILKKLAAKSSQ